MCERARRYLEATLPSRVKAYFPRGPQIFCHGQHCVSPHWPVWGILGISLWFLCEAYCAGLKAACPGRKQLARFWNIRAALLAIIGTSHDLRVSSPGPTSNWAFPGRSLRNAKSQKTLDTAMGHGGLLVPIALIGSFG